MQDINITFVRSTEVGRKSVIGQL